MNYLASPPLVRCVRAGGPDGRRHHARAAAGRRAPRRHLAVASARSRTRSSMRSSRTCSAAATARCSPATRTGTRLEVPAGDRYAWDPRLDLRQAPALLRRHGRRAGGGLRADHRRARDRAARRQRHHRPHLAGRGDRARLARPGAICSSTASSARDFNSYGSRRGNHEVMMRGTFANVRLRNQLAPGTEGGVTDLGRRADRRSTTQRWPPPNKACRCACWPARSTGRARRATGRPRARTCSGSGSCSPGPTSASTAPTSSAWACCRCSSPTASRPSRSASPASETFDLVPLEDGATTLKVTTSTGVAFDARVRIDTPNEWQYFRHGGILHFVLRQLRVP